MPAALCASDVLGTMPQSDQPSRRQAYKPIGDKRTAKRPVSTVKIAPKGAPFHGCLRRNHSLPRRPNQPHILPAKLSSIIKQSDDTGDDNPGNVLETIRLKTHQGPLQTLIGMLHVHTQCSTWNFHPQRRQQKRFSKNTLKSRQKISGGLSHFQPRPEHHLKNFESSRSVYDTRADPYPRTPA